LLTTGVELIHGRAELHERTTGPIDMVVNERAAATFWLATDVSGRRASLDDIGHVEIAGVIRDGGDQPKAFLLGPDEEIRSAHVLVRTSAPAAAMVAPVREVFGRITHGRVFTRVTTLRQASLGGLQRLTRMALVVAVVVLSLAAVGLYGSVSFLTSRRTREIAIRTALGAPRLAVVRMVARDGVRVVALGSLGGLLLSGVAFRFMSGMLFARWSLEPLTIAGVVIVLSLAAAAACYLPGRRAMRVEPMAVLRSE
jgi:hypothetical protein